MTENGVLVLTGPPCAGKSSVGRLLCGGASGRRMIYVEVDSLFSLLLPESDRNRSDRMLAYDAAHAVAHTVLNRGLIPVLECTYSRREQRRSLRQAMTRTPGAALWVVEFYVPPEDAAARFRRRDQETDLDDQLLRQRVAAFPYSEQALRLDTSEAAPDELANEINAWLAQQPASVQAGAWTEAGNDWT